MIAAQYLQNATPAELRRIIRAGEFAGPTAGLAPGYVQANLVVVARELAFDFLLFCQRNPKPCPVLEVTEPGDPCTRIISQGADVRTDLPRYRVYQRGEPEAEVTDIMAYWQDGMVAFLLGCSFTFERALIAAGIRLRHCEENRNVPMFRTSIQCVPAGALRGPMVVSMRPIPYAQVPRAVQVTSRFPSVHGAPVHIGDPAQIGIADIMRPDFGEPYPLEEGEVPVFWACGVTPQAVAMEARPSLMITHAPGHMFVSDLRDEHLALL